MGLGGLYFLVTNRQWPYYNLIWFLTVHLIIISFWFKKMQVMCRILLKIVSLVSTCHEECKLIIFGLNRLFLPLFRIFKELFFCLSNYLSIGFRNPNNLSGTLLSLFWRGNETEYFVFVLTKNYFSWFSAVNLITA